MQGLVSVNSEVTIPCKVSLKRLRELCLHYNLSCSDFDAYKRDVHTKRQRTSDDSGHVQVKTETADAITPTPQPEAVSQQDFRGRPAGLGAGGKRHQLIDYFTLSSTRSFFFNFTRTYFAHPAESLADEYEVERIVDVRLQPNVGSGCECLIKWKGWTDEYNQWEPLENLNCYQLLVDHLVQRKRLVCQQ